MDSQTFVDTVVYCASLIVRVHDQPILASTLLNESGVLDQPEEMRRSAEYDLAPLRAARLIPASIIGRE
jgi:hypothetical protein